MQVVLVLCLFLCFIRHARSAPSHRNAMEYLSKYGYLTTAKGSSNQLLDETSYKIAIKDFQAFAGLNVTGELDDTTLHTMTLPRCGVRDIVSTSANRAKRYAFFGSKWLTKELSYKISNYPSNLNPGDVAKEIQRALNVWSEYTDLRFTPGYGQVDLEIKFAHGEHGDGQPFDGIGNTLAHAYAPANHWIGGDAHFDASETWSINSYRGTNLFQVAAHEFGHSLGLDHSSVEQALMAPFYRGYNPYFRLHSDDIEGIRTLYGNQRQNNRKHYYYYYYYNKGFNGFGWQKNPVPSTPDQNLCADPTFDTIFNSTKGYTYVLKGDKYWKLTERSIAPGYPKLIAENWPGLPGNIDAAFTHKNGNTYFFKGARYWRYKNNKLDGTFPKNISKGFPGIPDDLDAALAWNGNSPIYFYKGSRFWRFDLYQQHPIKSVYPKHISTWKGVPDNITAVLQWTDGYTYFYKDSGYYRLNEKTFAVDEANPAFPRSTAYWWFGCKDSPDSSAATTASSKSREWLFEKVSPLSTSDFT